MKYIKNLMTNIICLFKFNFIKDYDVLIDHVDKLNQRINIERDKTANDYESLVKKLDEYLNRMVDLEYKVDTIKDDDLWELEKEISDLWSESEGRKNIKDNLINNDSLIDRDLLVDEVITRIVNQLVKANRIDCKSH